MYKLLLACVVSVALLLFSCKKEEPAPDDQSSYSIDGEGPVDLSGQQWVLYQYAPNSMSNTTAINDTLRFLTDSTYTWGNSTYAYEASRFWGRHNGSWLSFGSSPWGFMRMVQPYDVNGQTSSVFCYHRAADSTIVYLWFNR